MNEFDRIRKEGRLAYEYIRGSQLYGLNTPASDTDTGGVYLCMASEIAEGRGNILERTYDRQFLMDVRNHRYEYDELMAKLEEETNRMNDLMARSTIPDSIDPDFVNSLLIEIRSRQFSSSS